jgi:putative transposase
LPKIGKVRIKLHRRLPENFIITSVCVRITPAGVYEVSIQGKYEIEINQKKNLNLENSLGLDYSSEHFYVDSQGVKIDMPHYYRLS